MPSRPGARCASPPTRRALAPVLIAVLAATVYSWGLAHESLHPYYAAAARSMAANWRSFAFGALDPAASISVDKLPGALWVQALSVRAFGPHVWALILPQAAEGVAATVLLHRLVLRWAGAVAAAVAALVFALTPAVVVVSRSELSDPLLVLLSLAAARSLTVSLTRPGPWPLLRCGLWVAAAFQVKMAQSWLLLPVFAAVYLVDGPVSRARRRMRTVCMCLVSVSVSLVYVYVLWLIPAAHRPYVDGTVDDNPFSMVFRYDALDRFGQAPASQAALVAAGTPANSLGWKTLVDPAYFAPQYAWLAPLAFVGLGIGMHRVLRPAPDDRVRSGYLLWGGWLTVYTVVFSTATAFHGYYTAELAPPLAALAGDAAARLSRARHTNDVRLLAPPLTLAAGVCWAVWLDAHHTDFASWLIGATVATGLAAVTALTLPAAHPSAERTGPSLTFSAGAVLGGCSLLLAPAAWSLCALNPVYDGTPFAPMAGPVGSNHHTAVDLRQAPPAYDLSFSSQGSTALLDYLRAHDSASRYLLATGGAAPAEPFLDSGAGSVLVIGGFTGLAPFPSAPAFARSVERGEVRYAVLPREIPATAADLWVVTHCPAVLITNGLITNGPSTHGPSTTVNLYDCGPARAADPASGSAR